MVDFEKQVQAVRQKQPLVQCITNFVTVNDCANIILAAGGSPAMLQDIREAEEAVSGANALVCNMGAMDCIDSMILAGKRANQLEIPVIFDPVAAGGTQLRRQEARRLLENVHFSVIRGNASEIRFLAGQEAKGSGVDVSATDAVTEANLAETVQMAKELALRVGSTIAISGVLDVITDGVQTMVLRNGCAMMACITGSGCMLTALIGAFCGATPKSCFAAVCSAMAVMGVCGELAEEKRLANRTGNATFRTDLIDAVCMISEKELLQRVRQEERE